MTPPAVFQQFSGILVNACWQERTYTFTTTLEIILPWVEVSPAFIDMVVIAFFVPSISELSFQKMAFQAIFALLIESLLISQLRGKYLPFHSFTWYNPPLALHIKLYLTGYLTSNWSDSKCDAKLS